MAVRGGRRFPHARRVGRVHGIEFCHIGEKDVDVEDVVEIGTDRSEHDFEGIDDLCGLGCNAAVDQDTGCRIDTGRAANRDEIADLRDVTVGPDRLHRARRCRYPDLAWHCVVFPA